VIGVVGRRVASVVMLLLQQHRPAPFRRRGRRRWQTACPAVACLGRPLLHLHRLIRDHFEQRRSQKFVFLLLGEANHTNLYKNLIKIQMFNINLGTIGGQAPARSPSPPLTLTTSSPEDAMQPISIEHDCTSSSPLDLEPDMIDPYAVEQHHR